MNISFCVKESLIVNEQISQGICHHCGRYTTRIWKSSRPQAKKKVDQTMSKEWRSSTANITKQPRQKARIATLCTIDYNHSIVDGETDHLPSSIQNRQKKLSFDTMSLAGHDMILGYPLLQKSNPLIDWRTGQLWWADTVPRQHQKDPKGRNFATTQQAGEF